jgi:hypothetical protein
MVWLMAVSVVLAQPVADGVHLWESEVTAGVGVLASGFASTSTRVGDASLAPVVTARGVFGGFLVEGGALVTVPFARLGPYASVTLGARVGWTWSRFALSAGAVLQVAPAAHPPTSVLPSLKVHWQFLPVLGVSLGVLDGLGQLPVHLSAEVGPFPFGHFTVGFVGPLGASLGADLPLLGGVGLRVQAFYYRIPLGPSPAEFAMVAVSGRLDLGGAR